MTSRGWTLTDSIFIPVTNNLCIPCISRGRTFMDCISRPLTKRLYKPFTDSSSRTYPWRGRILYSSEVALVSPFYDVTSTNIIFFLRNLMCPPYNLIFITNLLSYSINALHDMNISVKNCMSQFSMFLPTKATVKLANWNMGHDQVIGSIFCRLLTVPLYIQWNQFIIVQVTLTTPPHQVPSNFIPAFKMLCLNLLNIVILLNLTVFLGYHPNRLKTILTILKSKLSESTLTETKILLSQLSMHFQKNKSLSLFISILVIYLLPY